jgi:predicted ester cyclase
MSLQPTYEEMMQYPHKLYSFWNANDMAGFYNLLDEDIKDHNAGEGESGIAGVKKALDTVHGAFPDSIYTVLNVIADTQTGMICAFLEVEGTQTGDLFGTPPSNKPAKWKEVRMVKLIKKSDGRVVTADHWALLDALSMMTQLGHVRNVHEDSESDRKSW